MATALLVSLAGANAHDMPGMDMSPKHGHAAHIETFTVGEPGKPGKVDRVVPIAMKDASFEPNSLDVKLNETIRFVITNTSTVDHEFILGDVAAEIAHRKEMTAMSDKGQEMHDDPNGIGVKAGKTRELIWKFTRAGNFEFDCDIPGHFESGMAGAIHVKGKS